MDAEELDLARATVPKGLDIHPDEVDIWRFILDTICESYGVSRLALMSTTRRQPIALARQMGMAMTIAHTSMKFTDASALWRRTDGATVRWAMRKVKEACEVSRAIKSRYDRLDATVTEYVNNLYKDHDA